MLFKRQDLGRAVHVNACVDASVNRKAVEKATEESKTMFTCSFCNETVAKGPVSFDFDWGITHVQNDAFSVPYRSRK